MVCSVIYCTVILCDFDAVVNNVCFCNWQTGAKCWALVCCMSKCPS